MFVFVCNMCVCACVLFVLKNWGNIFLLFLTFLVFFVYFFFVLLPCVNAFFFCFLFSSLSSQVSFGIFFLPRIFLHLPLCSAFDVWDDSSLDKTYLQKNSSRMKATQKNTLVISRTVRDGFYFTSRRYPQLWPLLLQTLAKLKYPTSSTLQNDHFGFASAFFVFFKSYLELPPSTRIPGAQI